MMAFSIRRPGRAGIAAKSLPLVGAWAGTCAVAQSPGRSPGTPASLIVPYPGGSLFVRKPMTEVIGNAAGLMVAEPAFRDCVAQRGNSAGTAMDHDRAPARYRQESSRLVRLARDTNLEHE